jgi:branched-chain amino acid transport system substrate-binding protein
MKVKKLAALLLSFALILGLAACGSTTSTPTAAPATAAPAEASASAEGALAGQTIIIGNIAPMTGALAAYGTAVDNAVRMAADEINAAGGILGATVEISTKDDQHTPAEAVSGFNALLSEGATAIIGAVASADTSAITGLANDEGIVLITATSTADSITTKDDYVFRSCFKDSFQGEMVAAYAASQGWTKAAVLYATGDAYSSGLRDAFTAAADKYGIEIVCEQSTSDTGAVDFSSQMATIAASGAQVLFAPYYYDSVGPKIIPQAREAGFEGAIMGADGFDGTQDYTTGDLSAYENVYFTNHYSPDDPSELVQNFVKAYTEKYGSESLNALGALAYDAMYMLKQAIETAGSLDHAAIREAMVGMHYVGVTGDMTLDETGTPSKSVAIMTFAEENGKLVQKFVTSQG